MQVPFAPARLLAREFPAIDHEYTPRDVQLYSLALGIGQDSLDEDSLRFVYKGSDGRQLKVLPAFANVLAYPGFWAREPDTGIDWKKLAHAEQQIVLNRALPASGHVVGRNRVTTVWDRCAQRGAFLQQRRDVIDAQAGATLATVTQLALLRGNGGFGSGSDAQPPPHPIPSRVPDRAVDTTLYRRCGDLNALHADAAVARAAGFHPAWDGDHGASPACGCARHPGGTTHRASHACARASLRPRTPARCFAMSFGSTATSFRFRRPHLRAVRPSWTTRASVDLH